MVSSTLCHECWTHWKKYGGPRIATSDKKVISAGRGGSISGDEGTIHLYLLCMISVQVLFLIK